MRICDSSEIKFNTTLFILIDEPDAYLELNVVKYMAIGKLKLVLLVLGLFISK